MPARKSSRSRKVKEVPWWLGPFIVYLCMLAALLLFTFISPLFSPMLGDDALAVLNQGVTYAIPILVIFLHVRRFERRESFWPSVGITRRNLKMAIVWAFAMYIIFYMVEGIYWPVATTVAGTDPRGEVTSYFLGDLFFDDLNGNGVWDNVPENFVDLNGNGVWDNAPENFVDWNGNGVWDNDEPLTDTYANGVWDSAEPFTDYNEDGERGTGFSDRYFLYSLFSAFLIVGLAEEIIFRGFITDRFLVKGPAFAIIVGSAMFAALHFWYIIEFGFGGLLLYGWLFLIAATWAVVYWKTRNIVGIIILHGLTNFSMPILYFFGATGAEILKASLLIVGGACLGYILLGYIRGMFKDIDTIVGKRRSGV